MDSLNAFFEHFNPDTTEGYRVTHLTLFNSGQLGDIDLVSALQNFHRSVKELEPFSQAVELLVLAIRTNLAIIGTPAHGKNVGRHVDYRSPPRLPKQSPWL